MQRMWITLVLLVLMSPFPVSAQDSGTTCRPGDEFCLPPPPCYREPDDPDCNPECTCDAADYPACDPFCAPGDICDPSCGNPCWDEFDRDICSDPPPPCEATGELPFTFIDDRDGSDDGQIFARSDTEPHQSCGTVRVDRTAYYSIFDTELSESCDDQRDETGYLTITNGCNAPGWAVERNADERFLVADSDNTPDCTGDADCGPGRMCRFGTSHGNCCVPTEPVFMGTFLLVEGEDNVICINHWCPEWDVEIAAGRDFGFVEAGCTGSPNSIHFQISASAIACEDETTLQPCSWGCAAGGCLPDPCDAMSCAAFCMDGICLDDNPCADVTCLHGCVRGRCLQNRHARGPDADGDGYSELADCDDDDPLDHPGRTEVCGDGDDDDCDGFIDEATCDGGGTGADGGGTGADGGGTSADGGRSDGGAGGIEDGGCGCHVTSSSAPSLLLSPLALLGFGLLSWRRRRR